MNTLQAFEHFQWRFRVNPVTGKHEQFWPSQRDLKAINIIVKAFNSKKTDAIDNNRLFAKCFVILLSNEVFRTKDYQLAINSITSNLRSSLESHCKQFSADMHLHSFTEACACLGLVNKDYSKGLFPQESKEEAKATVKKIKENESDLKKAIISEHWSYENTRTRLNHLTSEILTDNKFYS